MPTDCYILFPNHIEGWKLYELTRERGVESRISPTPRAARASCGVSLLVDCRDVHQVEQLAREQGISLEGMVRLPRQIDGRRDTFC